jgi:ferredoxin-NADP reductase
VAGVGITRPYSISSAPFEALGSKGYYEITVRHKGLGFMTHHMWDSWTVGSKVTTSGPCGTFYHEPLRDQHHILGLAGGSGVTPFRAMAREIVHGSMDADLTLLYGSAAEDDIICYDELRSLEVDAGGRFKAVHVLSCEGVTLAGCEQGFITAETIRRHVDIESCSIFMCGPRAMYEHMADELAPFHLPPRRVRREGYGEDVDVGDEPGFPPEAKNSTFNLLVHMGDATAHIEARGRETILVALERAGLAPPSQCRSGECGYCRSLLLAGEVFVLVDNDGRRAADKKHGYIHPCATYPLSDLEIRTPRAV